jgi:hypothetical protein
MPSIENWPAELIKEYALEMIKDKDWASQFQQLWPIGAAMDPEEKPLDAVRIHQAKGRGLLPPQAERLHFRFDKLRPIPEDSEPEQPYKNDPRYGTWG